MGPGLQQDAQVSGDIPTVGEALEVVAHVYDVTNGASEKANNTVLHLNRFFKDAIGLGGVFHTAIQVYGDEEWSFGYCEYGTGVFSCPPGKNPMYTLRESIVLGNTSCSIFMVNQILRELSWEWPGSSYEILSRNCNHFCDAFCEKLDVPKLPGWINRFANAGDAALEVAEITSVKLKQAKKEIMNACKTASTYLTGTSSSTPSTMEDTSGSGSGSSLFEGTWFRSLIGISMKPSKSIVNLEDSDDEECEDGNKSGHRKSNTDRNEVQKEATEELTMKNENESRHQP